MILKRLKENNSKEVRKAKETWRPSLPQTHHPSCCRAVAQWQNICTLRSSKRSSDEFTNGFCSLRCKSKNITFKMHNFFQTFFLKVVSGFRASQIRMMCEGHFINLPHEFRAIHLYQNRWPQLIHLPQLSFLASKSLIKTKWFLPWCLVPLVDIQLHLLI